MTRSAICLQRKVPHLHGFRRNRPIFVFLRGRPPNGTKRVGLARHLCPIATNETRVCGWPPQPIPTAFLVVLPECPLPLRMEIRDALVAEQSKQNGRCDQGKGMERDGEKKQDEGTADDQDA